MARRAECINLTGAAALHLPGGAFRPAGSKRRPFIRFAEFLFQHLNGAANAQEGFAQRGFLLLKIAQSRLASVKFPFQGFQPRL